MAEKKYIDREDYCKNVCKCNEKHCDKPTCPIWNAPTADVVEVVRCKDCVYNEIGSCKLSEDYDPDYDSDFYCANGERREQ